VTEKEVKIQKMLKLMKTDKTFKDQSLMLAKSMSESFGKEMVFDPEVQEKFLAEYFDLLDVDGMMEIVAPSYDKCFTEEEIDDMLVLFASPVYQKFVEKTPDLVKDFMEVISLWLSNRMPKIEKFIEEFMTELDKEDWKQDEL